MHGNAEARQEIRISNQMMAAMSGCAGSTFDVEVSIDETVEDRPILRVIDANTEIDRFILDEGFVEVLSGDYGEGRFYMRSERRGTLSLDVTGVLDLIRDRRPELFGSAPRI